MKQNQEAAQRNTSHLRSDTFMEHAISQHRGAVIRLALARTREPADAQDIAQEVFIRLLRSTTIFQDDNHLRAWLLRVTNNACIDFQRQAWCKRVEPRADMGTVMDRAVPDPAITAVMEHPVWQAMESLPDKLRVALHLHYVEGYPVNEAAQIMGCSATTARSRLHRGRKKLAAELKRTVQRKSSPNVADPGSTSVQEQANRIGAR